MNCYTVEFNGTGEVSEGHFSTDEQAQAWVESVLTNRGHDADEIVFGDWDADGQNDDGRKCERMLVWASEADANDDPGANSICQICVVR